MGSSMDINIHGISANPSPHTQSSDRAEGVWAALLALQVAREPTDIRSDNDYVIKGIKTISDYIAGIIPKPHFKSHADLWRRIECHMQRLGLEGVCAMWAKGHASSKDENKGIIQSWAWIMRFVGGRIASGAGALAYDHLGCVQTFKLNSMVPISIAIVAMFIPDKQTVEVTHWRETSSKL